MRHILVCHLMYLSESVSGPRGVSKLLGILSRPLLLNKQWNAGLVVASIFSCAAVPEEERWEMCSFPGVRPACGMRGCEISAAALTTAGGALVARLGLEAADMPFKAMEPVGSLTATAVLPLPPGFLLVRA